MEGERRTHPRRAVDGDLAMHERREALGDGQSQPCTVLMAATMIGLVVGLEDLGERLGRNAVAGITYVNGDLLPIHLDGNLDRSGIRKLHGVPRQVEQNLPEPLSVPL